MTPEVPENGDNLWVLAAAPAIWAAHFMLSYGSVAIWCAKLAGPDGSLSSVRIALATYTAVALAGLGLVGRRGWRRHRLGGAAPPHDGDTPEDRHRFLGLATLLLSGLSAVAILYATLPAVFIGTCR
jgi:hypothetical protein